jgi:hypothetical protein
VEILHSGWRALTEVTTESYFKEPDKQDREGSERFVREESHKDRININCGKK